MRRELRELKGDSQSEALYLEGRNKLVNSGVFNALRALGRPTRYEGGKDVQQMASEAAWSSGWNDCLDSLLHFYEFYLPPEAPSLGDTQADFGALDLAVERGDLTKEEADARKHGSTYVRPDPSQYTGNIKPPTRPPGVKP
jgi:hypothetical protein